MNKKFVYTGLMALILFAGLILSGCSEEEAGEEEIGFLTITNLPDVPLENIAGAQVYWYGWVYYDENITTGNQLINWRGDSSNIIGIIIDSDAKPYTGKSPFPLRSRSPGEYGFLKSGTFMVALQPAAMDNGLMPHQDGYFSYQKEYHVFKSSVTFNKGNATIDFNDMIRISDLP